MLSPKAQAALLAMGPQEAERVLPPARARAAKAIAQAATLIPVEVQPGALRSAIHINEAHAQEVLRAEMERELVGNDGDDRGQGPTQRCTPP